MQQTNTARQLEGRSKDLGDGMVIQRYLPHHDPQAVGPYIFFDYMPGLTFAPDKAMDVRPHPHIGLSTLSYLLDGRVHHRDSLGTDVILSPGDVLLMTSGEGIVHSERTPLEDRGGTHGLHMFQFWLALPRDKEQTAPAVAHARQSELPVTELQPGLHARLALGEFAGMNSPIHSHLEPMLLDLRSDTAGTWTFGGTEAELALFVHQGQITVDGQVFTAPAMALLPQRESHTVGYEADSHFLLLGGQPLDGHRYLWWNLVASSRELIEAASRRWQRGEFPRVPGDETEFIPLPDTPMPAEDAPPAMS